MGFSIGHLVLLLVIVLLVFGAGKVPSIMKDVAKGVKAFKDGIDEGETKKPEPIKSLPTREKQKTGTEV